MSYSPKFKVGDFIKHKEFEISGGNLRKVIEVGVSNYIAPSSGLGGDFTDKSFSSRFSKEYIETRYELAYKKVKATKLACKFYPNAEEKDGYLEIKVDA